MLALLAWACQVAEQAEAGLRAIDEALALAHDTREHCYGAEPHRFTGEPLLARGGVQDGRVERGQDFAGTV